MPKNEIKSRWRLSKMPPKKYLNDPVQIVQGYLPQKRSPFLRAAREKNPNPRRKKRFLHYIVICDKDRGHQCKLAAPQWVREVIHRTRLPRDHEVRVRVAGDSCFITVKSGSGKKRPEWEKSIPSWAFDLLFPETAGKQIKKLRYKIFTSSGHTLELDKYQHPAGKITMECEFSSLREQKEFILPDWTVALDPVDVTQDPAWKNKNLAC